jgi:hypothetical protein
VEPTGVSEGVDAGDQDELGYSVADLTGDTVAVAAR